jgi:hypothetical protein
LPVKLSRKEFDERATELASIDQEIEDAKQRKKDQTSEINEEIRRLRTDKAKLRKAVATKHEDREVECEWRPDWKRHEMKLFRLDTKSEVERRNMTANEIQMSLDDIEETEDATKKPN